MKAVIMKIFKRCWKSLLIVIFAAVWIFGFNNWSEWVTEKPLDMPITLTQASKIEKIIEIRMQEKYEICFIFERYGQPVEKMRTLIGAMGVCVKGPCPKGIPVPVKWSLSELNSEKELLVSQVNTIDSNGWGSDEVDRHIDYLHVKPGRYLFKLEVIQSVPELESIKSRLTIKIRPKDTVSWQSGLVWWGMIFTFLVAWPVLIFSLLITGRQVFNLCSIKRTEYDCSK
jgi:hypothetical protein